MPDKPVSEEIHLRVLRQLAANPEMSQRELADTLGVSLGKANYCLKALLENGLVKMRNVRNGRRKAAYSYCVTPAGLRCKSGLTGDFLKRKIAEHDALSREIELLKTEMLLSSRKVP